MKGAKSARWLTDCHAGGKELRAEVRVEDQGDEGQGEGHPPQHCHRPTAPFLNGAPVLL